MCHGASAPVPRASTNCDAKRGQPVGDLAQRSDVCPVTADAQLSHVIAERHTTQVGATSAGAGEPVEQIAATVIESEQETPRQPTEARIGAQQRVQAVDHRAQIGTATGQARLGGGEHIAHEFM